VTELPPEIEQRIADMSVQDFDLLVYRTRPPEEPADPRERAAAALRRDRGLDRKSKPASREEAAAALVRYHGAN
jgi:hypothetical protein